MIKFFRKIRYNLMETGKTTKYLKYAIGEILLVVIGILIALQVNNWNEIHKIRKEEHNTLQQLLDESNEIVVYLEEICNRYNSLIESIDKSANTLKIKSLNGMDEKEFAFGVYSTAFYEAISPPKSTYEELNSTGKINQIRSNTVRKSISAYYSELAYINTQLVYFRNQFTNPVEAAGNDFIYEYDKNASLKINPIINFTHLTNNDIFISKHAKALRDQIVFNASRKALLDYAMVMKQSLEDKLNQNK